MGGKGEATLIFRVQAKSGKCVKITAAQTSTLLPVESIPAPRQVFETSEHSIRVAGGEQAGNTATPPSTMKQSGAPRRDVKFRVSVSRAFGSIYVRARPLVGQRATRSNAVMARIKDEDLIPLVSPNWMET